MSERIKQLQAIMQSGWDRRLRSGYRYWMSDGVADDQQMWETGQRDFDVLFCECVRSDWKNFYALEIGCGVARILRAAAPHFAKVWGTDVSKHAVEKARAFLSDCYNVEVLQSSGTDLSGIASESIDIAYSFACFGHLPVLAFAKNLLEANRVIRPGGQARFQVYLGAVQPTVQEDSIAIRSYEKSCFNKATEAAGFSIAYSEQLNLPYDTADYEKGIVPYIIGLNKQAAPSARPEQVAEMLLPAGEAKADEHWPGSKFEYQLAITHAEKLIHKGLLEEAEQLLEYAVQNFKEAEPGAFLVLEELTKDR